MASACRRKSHIFAINLLVFISCSKARRIHDIEQGNLAHEAARDQEVQLFTWNPHWQCFSDPACRQGAEDALAATLVSNSIDFANLVELEDPAYQPPAGWSMLRRQCGKDETALLYDNRKWKVSSDSAAHTDGCMLPDDRPFVIQLFEPAASPVPAQKLLLVGAHFPHGVGGDVLRAALGTVMNSTGESSVILLADTNADASVSSSNLMHSLGVQGVVTSTSLQPTCCFNDNFTDAFTFDRIFANFGEISSTTVVFDQLPTWARIGELHKGIQASFSF